MSSPTPAPVSVASRPIPQLREPPLIGSLREFAADRLSFFLRMSRECPDICSFHVGPVRFLYVSSPSMISTIMSGHGEDFAPSPITRFLLPLFGPNSLLLLHGEPHREQRRMMSPVFQPRRVSTLDKGMMELAANSVSSWREGEVLSLPEALKDATLRIVGKWLFGVDFSHEAADLSLAVNLCMEQAEHLSVNPIHLPMNWPTPRNRRVRQALDVLSRRMKEMVAQRRLSGQDSGDLLSMMLAHRDEDGNMMSEEQLRDQCITLFAAGYETTAVLLAWLWGALLQNPEVYAKLQHEVDTCLEGRTPTSEATLRMPYLQQVIKESVRLNPPSYMQGRAALRDVEIEGYTLRKGDSLLISPYALHRNERYYPDPERFIPERFTPEQEKERPRNAYMPFGHGPNVCIGKHFAILEAGLMMCLIMQQVRLELMPGETVRAAPVLTLQLADYRVRVHRRDARGVQGKAQDTSKSAVQAIAS